MRMLDSLIVAGLIEARSHERLSILSLNAIDDELKELYKSLLESEARHFGAYWNLAKSIFSGEETQERLRELAEIEGRILSKVNSMPRIHS